MRKNLDLKYVPIQNIMTCTQVLVEFIIQIIIVTVKLCFTQKITFNTI